VRLARNETFATNDERLEEGDVIALIPPIAGG
jgi:molybdopterin converting factor small subunit